jgi:recombination protein RecA
LIEKFAKAIGKTNQHLVQESLPVLKKFRTGVFPITLALEGGFPAGRGIEIWGGEDAFKTTLVLKFISEHIGTCYVCGQKECTCGEKDYINVLWVDAENALDVGWASRFFNPESERFIYVKPDYGEQISDIVSVAIDQDYIHIIVVDSLADMVPMVELEESAEKNQQGASARMTNKAIRRWTARSSTKASMKKHVPVMIVINQKRQKIGMFFGDNSVLPGGMGQLFWASVSLKMWHSKVEYKDQKAKDVPELVNFGFHVSKSKVSVPYVGGDFQFSLADLPSSNKFTVADNTFVLDKALETGVIEKSNASYATAFEYMDKGKLKFKGKGDIIEILKNDRDFKAIVENKIVEMLFGKR